MLKLSQAIRKAWTQWRHWDQTSCDELALKRLGRTHEEARELSGFFEGRFDGLCNARWLTTTEEPGEVAAGDKQCPSCGNVHLVRLRTRNEKVCGDCGTTFAWNLDPGQKAVGY